ncbi:MAG: hypothetical protein LBJ63_00265 [Prevotellaceae bacterium]|jgi:hypothetical protein|nr:hypothetical protein [Prevotellaceae bacterium]
MKTLIKLRKLTQRILAIAALFFVSLAGYNASAQTRSYTLEVLQKTDYIIDDACDIVDYFYFNDGELIAKSMHFQDYAYHLYDLNQFKLSLQYSLKARSYAVNAIEICDDYWQYYDYYYYGYSPAWGYNSGFTVKIGNVQLHWGLANAQYHSNLKVNWDMYFTARELNYYKNLPSERILLNGFYKYKGMTVYFNDRHINRNVYQNMRVHINKGRDSYAKSNHSNNPKHMPSKPKDMRPHNAPAPTHTRRETVNRTTDSHNNRGNTYHNNTSDKNKPNNSNKNTDAYKRNTNDNRSNHNSVTNNNNNDSRSSQARRGSNTENSKAAGSSGKVDSKSNSTQETQPRKQSARDNDTKRQSSSSSSTGASSNNLSRRR